MAARGHGPEGSGNRLEEKPSGFQKGRAATRMGSRGSITRAGNSPAKRPQK
jgi:hypothetical protein